MREANRKQAMVPEGAVPLDPVGTAPGPGGAGGRAGRDRPARAAARAAADVGGGGGDRAGAGGAGAGDAAARLHDADVRGARVGNRQEPARDGGRRGSSWSAVEITTCLRRGEIEIDVRYRDEAAAVAEAVREGLARAPPRETFSLDGETIDAQVATLLLGHRLAPGGVLQRRPAGGADHRSGRRLGVLRRRRRRLLERGQGGAARGRSGADRGQGGGLAGGRRGDGDRRAGALRRRRRGLDHRHRRSRRRQRGEAGRLRLLQRPPRRRDQHRPRPGDPRRPRRHPRTLGPGRDAPAAAAAR